MKNKPIHQRFGFAVAGILGALRSEQSLRLQAIAAVGVLAALIYLRPAPVWWAVIALTTMTVLAAELLNTAVEHLADHLHPEQHPHIQLVKDCAAGGVLLASIGALCVAAAFVWDLL